jgi:hypothetical protein
MLHCHATTALRLAARLKDSGLTVAAGLTSCRIHFRELRGRFHAGNNSFHGGGAFPFGVGRPSSAAARDSGRHDRSSAADSRSAANFRTVISGEACTGEFALAGKRTGCQRLHRRLCARRYTANPIFHGSIAGVGSGSGVERRCAGWSFHAQGQSGPMQHSRPRD